MLTIVSLAIVSYLLLLVAAVDGFSADSGYGLMYCAALVGFALKIISESIPVALLGIGLLSVAYWFGWEPARLSAIRAVAEGSLLFFFALGTVQWVCHGILVGWEESNYTPSSKQDIQVKRLFLLSAYGLPVLAVGLGVFEALCLWQRCL